MNRVLIPVLIAFTVVADVCAIETHEVIGPQDSGGRYKHPTTFTQLDNGDLYLAFYGGSGEYSTDTAVSGSRLVAGYSLLVARCRFLAARYSLLFARSSGPDSLDPVPALCLSLSPTPWPFPILIAGLPSDRSPDLGP